jgi:glycosyltransferase involved in cell wall biosynthesis
MKVLTICPTYGRPQFLGRVVASFLMQTHTDSDLVIINDDPHVNIVFKHNRVTVVNLNKKHLLDVKRNIGAIMGINYDLIMPLDDDDIYLPQQIEYHVRKFQENPDIDFFRNADCFITLHDQFKRGTNSPNSNAYRPSAFLTNGGYDFFEKNSSGDVKFANKFTNKLIVREPENAHFVYFWYGGNYHLSVMDEKDLEGVAADQRKKFNIVGDFIIEPDFEEVQTYIDLSKKIIGGEQAIDITCSDESGKIKTNFRLTNE